MDAFHIRLGELHDVAQIQALIPVSVRELQRSDYSSQQMDGALGTVFAVDTQLILDRTYFVAEHEGRIVGCGGWSRRKTQFGGDAAKRGPDLELDPARDAARIRAFFVDPQWARRGIGTAILRRSEAAAIAAGFKRIEITATLAGEQLYTRFGYEVVQRFEVALPNGASLPVVKMEREIERSSMGEGVARELT